MILQFAAILKWTQPDHVDAMCSRKMLAALPFKTKFQRVLVLRQPLNAWMMWVLY